MMTSDLSLAGHNQDGLAVEITEAMIQAGYLELRERSYGEDLKKVAEEVYRAMEISKLSPDF